MGQEEESMGSRCWRPPVLGLLVCLFVSTVGFAWPGFSDRNIARGNLNPTDTIEVQEIRVTRSSGETVTLSSITIQNLGTAGDGDIDKITVMDGGDELGWTTDIAALATGVTVNLGGFAMTSTTHDLKIYVTVGTAVEGGETVNLRCKIHYVRNLTESGSSVGWISDLTGETIRNGGFDVIEDSSPDAGYFNPGDGATVQVAVFTDNDANGSPVLWDAVGAFPVVKVENLGTATNTDIQDVTVTLRIAGVDYGAGPKAWPATGGVTFNQNEPFAPVLGTDAVADNASMTVTVAMTFRGKNSVTDGRTVRTKVTVYVDEQGEGADGERVEYEQSISAAATQTIRKQGFERIEEESESLSSGTAATGDVVVQTVRCYDDDSNTDNITAWRVYIRNMGSATGNEISKIEVKAGATTLRTILPADLAGFKTGTWYNFTTNKLVIDDAEQVFKIYYTIGTPVDGHALRPAVRIEGREPPGALALPWIEADDDYPSDEVTYPDELGLYEPGFEFVENWTPPEGGTAFSGQRLLAQTIRLEDRDQDSDSVTIHPVVVKNLGTATGNPDVTKIEVWRRASETATAIKLGETTDLSGFRIGGARIDLTHDNVVTDVSGGAQTFLDIYLTIAEPEVMVAGRTIQLDTRVLHTEKQKSYDKHAGSNQWTLETNHRPVVDFTYTPATPTYDNTLAFTATVTDEDGDAITAYAWTFGDTGTATGQTPTHRYGQGGTFQVTVAATDARGVSGSKTKTVTVSGPPNVPPTVTFVWTPAAPGVGQSTEFTATVTDSDQPAGTAFTYLWDFGDGTTSTLAVPSHSFAEKKNYTITLKVTDAAAGQTTVTRTLSIGNAPPVANFQASKQTVTVGEAIQLTDSSTDADGTVAAWLWTFGDGATSTSTAKNPSHTYSAVGSFTVTLVVTDDKGGESAPKALVITVTGPGGIVTHSYPNPAKDQATLVFYVPEGATDLAVRIYDVVGRLVHEADLPAGDSTYVWDLRSDDGADLPTGLYFYVIAGKDATGKVIKSPTFKLLIAR
jgi:PKD repeat protein